MGMTERLAKLGLELPAAAAPVASYVATVEADNMLYISGQVSIDANGQLIRGRLGADLDVAQGQAAAQRCALMIMAQMNEALGGSFGRVERIVRLTVFVQSAEDFTDQPKVANGASDLFVQVFGDAGRHTRSAVGVQALPLGVAVEIDAIVQLR